MFTYLSKTTPSVNILLRLSAFLEVVWAPAEAELSPFWRAFLARKAFKEFTRSAAAGNSSTTKVFCYK